MAWFSLFQKTWMDIYFNEKTGEETNRFGIFEETKKKGFTSNLVVLVGFFKKMYLTHRNNLSSSLEL
jgi:hypothetical protein